MLNIDITTRPDIDHLLATFYTQAMADETIGHIFTEVAKIDLETHLPIIGDFWESILLGNPVYRGNPMRKHFALADETPLLAEHFAVWLTLWEATVRANFVGEKADMAVQRAQNIGRLMRHKLEMTG
jgi:hemoglobin